MLIALILVMLLGFGGGHSEYFPKDLGKRLKAEISDKELRKEVDAIAKQIDKDVADYRKEMEELAREELSLNADYDADPEKFEELVDRIVGSREEIQKKLINDHFSLVDLLTEEQWNAVFFDGR